MNSPAPVATSARSARGISPGRSAWRRLLRNRLALGGLILLAALILFAVAGPFLSPYGHNAQNLSLGATPPSAAHWFGTDMLGRDLCTRMMQGGRISLLVGLCATATSLLIGVAWGAVAGFAGGRIDSLMMRIVDILYALPFTIFVILLMVFFERKLWLIFVAIGAIEWLTMARIVRGQVLALKHQDFVVAMQALGAGRRRIITRHLVPNLLGPVIVYATLTIPGVMLLEAFLSFLGLGVQAPATSWGVLIKEGADAMEEYPWMLAFPGVAIAATLFSLNFVGDGLRDALDVRSEC